MPSQVTAPDGVRLAVHERGAGPTVVAVHGYPDDHSIWDRAAELLADRFRVVAYDVRGAGTSDHPAATAAYRMTHLVDDLVAVLDAVSPDAPVHLLGHDWGSCQCWAALTDARLAGRIATFTSISGPSLEYAAAWLRDLRGHPGDAARQLAHSSYVLAFQLPWLPELAIRAGLLERLARHRAARADQVAGLRLYRANRRGGLRRPRPVPTGVRVQVLVPDRDPFITEPFATEPPRPWVADLTVHRVPGGHWVMRSRPQLVAGLVADFAVRPA
jgi:pimeloyl-ACP methyl ester carboxylesterase